MSAVNGDTTLQMATITTVHERGTTAFQVTWKDPGAVSARVCEQEGAFLQEIADAIVPRKLSRRARSRPWSLTLELSRKDVSDLDLDEYFAGLADLLYKLLVHFDPEGDLPESIDIEWPASKHEGVYKAMTYAPVYDDESASA